MKKLLYFASAIMVLSFCSIGCKDNLDMELSKSPDMLLRSHSKVITVAEAKRQALDFIKELGGTPQTRSSMSKEIGDVYAWRYGDIFTTTRAGGGINNMDTMLYIVNFTNNEGYVLVSADDPGYGVIAYVEEGNMTPDKQIDNPGYRLFLEGLGDMPNFDPQPPMEPDTNLFNPDPLHQEFDWINTRKVNPLLHTKWGTYAPFNTNINTYFSVGCGTIAFGQILSKFCYPTSFNNHTYDWEELGAVFMPTSPDGEAMAANLAVDILSNTQYTIDYDHLVYGHDTLSRFMPCWDIFNYTYDYGDYNFDQCMTSLESGYPVMISGVNTAQNAAHIWVIDGGMDRYYGMDIALPGAPPHIIYTKHYQLVHCNWGWYGEDNGYFLSNAFNRKYVGDVLYSGTQHPYNLYTTMFYNIHPNVN